MSEVSNLGKVDLNFYSESEAYCFFLNIYQGMYVHGYLKSLKKQQLDESESSSMFANLKKMVWKSATHKFFYCIGGLNYSLEELKHGVLRGNRKKPGAILRLLGNTDARSQFITDDNFDPRVLFLCLDLPQIMEHIECFDDPDTMNEKLNIYLREYFNVKVELDTINEELILPSIFQTYNSDFGSRKDVILEFLGRYFDNSEYDLSQVGKSLTFKFTV